MGEERQKHQVAVGQVFGHLTVTQIDLRLPNIRTDRRSRVGERAVMVRCQCGDERLVKLTNLVSPKSSIRSCRSCGASRFDKRDDDESIYYNLWRNIKNRCYDDTSARYAYYGGRGIRLSTEWTEYQDFRDGLLADIGPRPSGMTLGRIDTDGDYAPGNVSWDTSTARTSKRRTSKE